MENKTRTPEEKQLRLMRLQTAMLVLILLLIAALVFFVIGKVNTVVAMVQQVDVQQINDTVLSLKNAADNLGNVDMDSLNAAIGSLSDTAGQISRLDFQKLSDFMDSLDTLGEQMDGVSQFFSNFLRR